MEIQGVLIFFGPLPTKDGGAPLPTDRISLLDRCDDGPEMLIFSKSQNRYYHLRWQSPKIICWENPRVFAARLVLDRRRGNFCSKKRNFHIFQNWLRCCRRPLPSKILLSPVSKIYPKHELFICATFQK